MTEAVAQPDQPMTDGDLAAHLAQIAGRILIDVRDSGLFTAKALGNAGDQTANQFLVHGLREVRPDDGLLSEEMKNRWNFVSFLIYLYILYYNFLFLLLFSDEDFLVFLSSNLSIPLFQNILN